jgi:hypothetical protein
MPHAPSQPPDIRLSVFVASGPPSRRLGPMGLLALGLATLLVPAGPAMAGGPASPPARAVATSNQIQKLVDDTRKSLKVKHGVTVELVPDNPLKASVEPVKGVAGGYRLAIDLRFLEQLSEDELKAVVAHELGHVWIYTHFPYLQTEQLANQIAMRVVTRDSLDRVYGKVWANASAAGSLPRFSEEPTVAAGLAKPQAARTSPDK